MNIVKMGNWVYGCCLGNTSWMQIVLSNLGCTVGAIEMLVDGYLWRKCQPRGSGCFSAVSCSISALGALPSPPILTFLPAFTNL